ncbi:restriction endonuclease subunit S [Lysinibacillus sp. K60]|uniref:restriction endonuclease subunit S n=1 Tax=Lysinibacillus sp. K60 TaxID=2720027 RepID=UPI001C8C4335|nr:restriction endonuclease subunit S [Lysinibacillus sp. K60]MBX8945340.1 restriction endonuclease subunit S [Lysinibacillus sp. K60]
MKWIKLGDIIDITKGKKHNLIENPSRDSKRVIFTEDLRSDENIKYTNDEAGIFVEKSDILIAWDGANAGIVEYGKSGFIGSTIGRLRIKEQDKYYPPYIGVFLKKQFNYFQRTSNGAVMPHINRNALTNLKIPVVKYVDQYRIAQVLSQSDSLIKKRKESIRLLDDLLLSTFLKMFGSKSKNYQEWPLLDIKQIAKKEKNSIRTGPFGSNLKHSEFTSNGDVAVLGIDNAVKNKFEWKEARFISHEKYEELKKYKIYPRDIIITIMGTVGKSAVIPEDIPLAINTKHLAAITLDESLVNPYFISFAIHSSPLVKMQLFKRNRGAVMSGLNLGIIKELKIKVPPLSYQNKFEAILKKIEDIKKKYEDSLQLLEILYKNLENKVFLGKINLNKISIEGLESIKFIQKEVKEKNKNKNQQIDIISIIKSKRGEELSMVQLIKSLEKSGLQELPDHDEIKNIVFSLLKGPSPILSQYFDEIKNEVVLKVNR